MENGETYKHFLYMSFHLIPFQESYPRLGNGDKIPVTQAITLSSLIKGSLTSGKCILFYYQINRDQMKNTTELTYKKLIKLDDFHLLKKYYLEGKFLFPYIHYQSYIFFRNLV